MLQENGLHLSNTTECRQLQLEQLFLIFYVEIHFDSSSNIIVSVTLMSTAIPR